MKHALLPAALMSVAMLGTAQAQTQPFTVAFATTDMNIRSGPGPEHPVIGNMRMRQRATVLGCIEGSLWCQVEFRGLRGWAYSQYMSLDSGSRRVVVTETVASVAPQIAYEVEEPVIAPRVAVAPLAPTIYREPVVTYSQPAPVVTYRALGPVVTYREPAPVVTYREPAPMVTYREPAPVVTYRAPAPAVTYRAPARTTTTIVDTTGSSTREITGTLVAPPPFYTTASALIPPPAVSSYITTNALDSYYLDGNVAIGAGIPGDIELSSVPDYRFQYTYVNDRPVLVDPASRRIVYVYR